MDRRDAQVWITGVHRFTRTHGPQPWHQTFNELAARSRSGGHGGWSGGEPNMDPIPPIGTWRADPHLRYVEQLQTFPIDDLDDGSGRGKILFTEDPNDPHIRVSVDRYIDYYRDGLEPQPGDVVWNEVYGKFVTTNRRRLVAARLAGRHAFKAWVGGDRYDDMFARAIDMGEVVAE